MGRNWYSTMYSRPDWAWIVIYAYGITLEAAFAQGFYRSDLQPHPDEYIEGDRPGSAADRLARRLNEQERLASLPTTTTPRRG